MDPKLLVSGSMMGLEQSPCMRAQGSLTGTSGALQDEELMERVWEGCPTLKRPKASHLECELFKHVKAKIIIYRKAEAKLNHGYKSLSIQRESVNKPLT